jgi:hypothetical protein
MLFAIPVLADRVDAIAFGAAAKSADFQARIWQI